MPLLGVYLVGLNKSLIRISCSDRQLLSGASGREVFQVTYSRILPAGDDVDLLDSYKFSHHNYFKVQLWKVVIHSSVLKRKKKSTNRRDQVQHKQDLWVNSLKDNLGFCVTFWEETEKMTGSEIKKPEGYHPVNSHIKENGESNGSISVYPRKHKTANLKPPLWLHFCVKRTTAFYIAHVSVILNIALVITLLRLSVRARGPSPPTLPTCPVVSCPSGWIGYQRKCYYFTKAEGNWTSSKRHCFSFNASLAVVDSQEEMDFMMRYKGNADYWIGLERNLSQTWTWINGTIFNGQ
ncbi:UNVERIFIED_CONTAM: hypothetical protein K2H54_060292 [Gekko kuhli]